MLSGFTYLWYVGTEDSILDGKEVPNVSLLGKIGDEALSLEAGGVRSDGEV